MFSRDMEDIFNGGNIMEQERVTYEEFERQFSGDDEQ